MESLASTPERVVSFYLVNWILSEPAIVVKKRLLFAEAKTICWILLKIERLHEKKDSPSIRKYLIDLKMQKGEIDARRRSKIVKDSTFNLLSRL